MADAPDDRPAPQADMFSLDKDGQKVDAWICEELLGDDPVDPDYVTVLGADDDADVEDDL